MNCENMENIEYDAVSFPINRLRNKLPQINIGVNLRVRISRNLAQVLEDQIGQVVNPTRRNLRLMMWNKY